MKKLNQEEYEVVSSLISTRMYDLQDSLTEEGIKFNRMEQDGVDELKQELTSLKTAWEKIQS
jgi:hypothetical protein